MIKVKSVILCNVAELFVTSHFLQITSCVAATSQFYFPMSFLRKKKVDTIISVTISESENYESKLWKFNSTTKSFSLLQNPYMMNNDTFMTFKNTTFQYWALDLCKNTRRDGRFHSYLDVATYVLSISHLIETYLTFYI